MKSQCHDRRETHPDWKQNNSNKRRHKRQKPSGLYDGGWYSCLTTHHRRRFRLDEIETPILFHTFLFFNHSCLLSSLQGCLPFTPFILSPTLLFSVGRICSCTHRRGGGDSRRSTGWRCGGRRGREMITAVGGSQVFAKEIFIVHVVCRLA